MTKFELGFLNFSERDEVVVVVETCREIVGRVLLFKTYDNSSHRRPQRVVSVALIGVLALRLYRREGEGT